MPQGTIKDFDIETGRGVLVSDAKEELVFDTQTFLDSGLEELRIGQRVRYRLHDDDVTDLQIVSL